MTSPFSFPAFEAEQARSRSVGPRRPSSLSYAAFEEEQRAEEERIRAERGARDGVLPAVVTTAPAPKPFERALARGVLASGATAPAFGREEDLTPLARQQVERAKAARAVAEDLGKAVVGQPMRSATRLAAGAATLAGLPQAEPLTRVMRSIEEQTAPTTTPGAVARVGTEIGAMAPGGFALGATRAALESAAGESTVNALLEATGRAPIESPVVRALAEAGLDVAALGVGKALGAGARGARQAPDVTPPLALPPGPIRDRGRLLGAGTEAPVQGPVSSRPIPMGGVTTGGAVPTVGSETLGPGIPTPGVRQLFFPRPPRPTEGPRVLGPAIPMGGPPPPRRLTSGAPRPTAGDVPLGPEPLPPELPVFGPAIPMRGVPSGPTPITDPTRLLPSSVPEDVSRKAVQARMESWFSGQPARLAERERLRAVAEVDRLAAASPERLAQINESRALDVFPDGTERIKPGEGFDMPYARNRRSVRRMSDREVALELNMAEGEMDRLTSAIGEADAYGGLITSVDADNLKTRSAYLTPAQRRKRTMAGKRPTDEVLSRGEKRELGYDMTEDARGRLEEAGMSPTEFRQMVRAARQAERRLPSVTKRMEELREEVTRRGLDKLPKEIVESASREAPASVTREMQEFSDYLARSGRRGAVAPEALVPAGTAGLGAVLGAATTPEDAPESMVGRAMAGALAGFGAGRVGLRGVERLADATAARRGTAAIPEGIPDGVSVPDRAAAMREAALRTAPEEVVTPRPGMTEARMERAAERVQRPARPTPSDATYVPRTDEEWREFYGRFMTRPEDIAEADALRQTGVTQQRQGTRPVELDTKLSETIGETFGDLAFRDAGRKLSGPELIALRAQREANAARRVALAERLADPNLSPVDREWMTSLRDRLEDVMITQLERYTRDVSQTGRDLRLLQEAVKLSDNPADWLLRAERMAGGQKLTPAQELELITAVREKNLPKAAGLIGKLRETGWMDKAGELWQTGLLTSVARPLRDVLGNFINLADKQAERVVATGVDRLLGLTTGVRTADYSLPATAKAFGPALKRGGEAAMAILRGKGDPAVLERVMQRYDFERETLQTNPMLRAYTTLIRRTIGAADALVSEVAMTAALGEQARVLARTKGLTEGTPAFQEAVAKYLDAPPPEMLGLAAAQAAEVTWQNSTALGSIGMGLRQAKSPEVRLLGKLAVPFVQTPSAMAMQAVRGTPFGLLGAPKDVIDMAKKADLPAAQRQLVGRVAKSTVGAGWIALGYSLADNDQMTSWFPSEDRERRRWELEGRTETAVKIGGTWVSLLGVLGPQAMLMSIGASLRKLTDDPEFVQRTVLDQATRTAGTMAQGAGRALLDSPMMQGMRSVTELGQQVARGDPEGLGEAGAQAAQTFLGGMVPQVVQQAARATDLTDEGTVRVRQPLVPGNRTQTAINAVLQGIPGLRQQVPVRRTALGEERATSVGGLAGVLSPARLSRETSDPRAQELWRTGAAVPRTTQRRGEPAETFSARQEALGGAVARAVQAAMNDPQYQAIARMSAADLRAALRAQVAERGGDLPELRRLEVLPDDEIRRRYQGMVLDNVIRAARTQAGAAFPDPRGGRAGSIIQSLTRP